MDEVIRVVHVDDDPELAATTATRLEGRDERFDVEATTDATRVMERLDDVDCVVSGYDLSGTDGVELLGTVREEYPDLPFVLFTDSGSEAVASEAISAGVTDYVQKGSPDQHAVLATRIGAAVDEHRSGVGSVTGRDASERDRLDREASRYRRILDEVREAACLYDERGRFVVANEHLAAFYDTTPDGLVGRESELLSAIEAAEDGDPFGELVEGDRETVSGELRTELADYGPAVLDYRLARVEFDGEFDGVAGVAREVTDWRASERELERNEQIIREMNDGVVVVSDGEITYTNPAVSEIVEYPAEQLRGESMDQFIAPEDRETVRRRFRRRIAGEDPPQTYEITVVSKSGDRIPVEITVARVEGGDRPTTVSIVRDISDRKRHERELERQNDRLEEFAKVVSHDLRNPLSVAEGHLELARQEIDNDHLDAIERSHERMRVLIEDLLTLAREGGRVEEVEPTSLALTATDCWGNVDTNGAELVTETDASIMADRRRLKQLFENLIRNSVEHGSTSIRPEVNDSVEHGSTDSRPQADDSVEHSPTNTLPDADDGETTGVLTVTVGELDDGTGFYVADDGSGIPADKREQVFESGYSTAEDGTGFGLSIVEEIVEAHGWTVDVTESADGGARFEIRGVSFADR